MNPKHPLAYRPTQKFVHWAVFFLVIIIYSLTYATEFFPSDAPERRWVWWFHVSFGLLLAGLIVWRIIMRLMFSVPQLPPTMSTQERRLARMVHKLLYALLIIAPATGIVLASARGVTLSFFGLFSIPGPIETNQSLARTLYKVHYVWTHSLLIVAGLHAMVALWHHFIRRNDILTRMLPKRHH